MDEQQSSRHSVEQAHFSETGKSIPGHQFQVTNPVTAKKIYFYKSGDPQFSGIRMAINRYTFKTFDSLLDDLSNKIPLPFGVRTITTPRGGNSVTSLSDLEDGKSYICSDQRKVKPINLELAKRKQHPWFISKPFNPEQLVSQRTRQKVSGSLYRDQSLSTGVPKKLVIFRNGEPSFRRNLILNRNTAQNFDILLNNITVLMQFPVLKLYSTDGKRIDDLYPLKHKFESVVAAGREGFKLRKYNDPKLLLPGKLPHISNRVQPKPATKTEQKNHKIKSGRRKWMINSISPSSSNSQVYSTSSDKLYVNDSKNFLGSSSSIPENEIGSYKKNIYTEDVDRPVMPSEDDIEKSIYVNEDGSMTVEMRVRLRIKEEETIQWTTTISRSGICNKKSNACNLKLESDVESADLINAHSHHNTKPMHFEDFRYEQEFDDLCAPQKCTMHTEQDEEVHFDIWQNRISNTNENLPKSGVEFKPSYRCEGSPGHGKVRQDQVSLESITAKSDSETSANIVQFSNPEETRLGENLMENYNELFSISNEKESCEISSEAASEELQTWEEIDVNTQGEEKTILDKSTSFVGKDSSQYSGLYFEDQLAVPKMINSINESTNATNIFSQYWGKIGCVDTDINFAEINLRPSSADSTYSISKQGKKDVRRPMSASFRYSSSSVSIHNETSSLSSRMVCSLTSTERKQKTDVNTNCAYSSEFCEARMSLFLANLNSVSKCSQSSTVKNQDCTKTTNEVEMPMNTDSNDSSTNTEERAFCRAEEISPVNNESALSSRMNEKKCRKHTIKNTKLHPEYGSHSQPAQLLDQLEKTEVLSDHCTTHSSGQGSIEMVDTDKYQSTEFNTVEISNESNVTFQIGYGSDSSVSHSSTDLIPPKEETDSRLSQLPIARPPEKGPSTTESLDNRLQRMGDQESVTISNSSAMSSRSENVSEVNTCQDIFSEHEQTTLVIACTKELNLCHQEGVQCSAITTEGNSDLPESSLLIIEFDSKSTSDGNKKQITGINSSSTENDIQRCSSNPSWKKQKNQAKKSNKILNISEAEKKDFKHDAQSSVLLSTSLQQKEQELYNADIPQTQDFVQNWLRRISPTSDMVNCDLNLKCYPPTQFEEEKTVGDLASDIIEETNDLPDDDSDFINQTKRHRAETDVPTEHKLIQKSAKTVSKVKRTDEVPEDCNNDDSLQSQVSVAKGEVKPALVSNEIQYRAVTKMIDIKSNLIEFTKATIDIAVQADIGVVSETADEKDTIGEQDLRHLLGKLQSTVDTIKTNSHHRHKSCLEKSYGIPDVSEHFATTLSTSSKILLAWLAIMNLNVNVPASPDGENVLMNNCSCSKILTFLQSIRHVIEFQETDDLKQSISDLQKCASHLVKVWKNEHKEKSSYAFENYLKTEYPLQTRTSGDETASFDAPQLTNVVENKKYFDVQNLIEQLDLVDEVEAKKEFKYDANIENHSNKEDKTEEAGKAQEMGDKEPKLFSSKDNSIFADILEDQVTADSLLRNEGKVEETTVTNKECAEKETVERANCTEGCDLIEEFATLQQIEDMRPKDIAKDKEFLYNNCMDNNENRHSEKLKGNETNNHFTCASGTENKDELSAASNTVHLQNKISVQKFMHHKSLLVNDKCDSNHRNVFCQGECMSRSSGTEVPVSTSASVVSNSDFENEKNKTDSKQLAQRKEICKNPFFEGEVDKELLPYTCASVPLNHNVKQCLERQQTSDLSEGGQASANSIENDYNSQASNEMTTDGEEDVFVKPKHFSASFVRKATERLYGKSHVVSKHLSHDQPPSACAELETARHTRTTDSTSFKISTCSDKSSIARTCGIDNELLNVSGLDKGHTFQKSQDNNAQSEEGGVFIEKGRWLLKENHLIRKSPPLNMGMYGNLDTTSVDTAFDNTSDDTAYPHVSAMHSGPPLTELSSSEIEETIKPEPMCNYFNTPHGSDSEPFPDLISLKSKYGHVCSGSHLIKKHESNKQSVRASVEPTQMCTEVNDNDSSFTSVEFHMFDNKVSPLTQPLADGTVVEQPFRETARTNRTLQNPDSLDKLHFICGQHCPILTAVIEPTNEERRRFVYQKKSDPENQWILHSGNDEDIYTIRKYNDLIIEHENCSILNKNLIHDIISDITNWFKTQSIENDIKRIKLSLDAKYLGANHKTLKVPLHTKEAEFKIKSKPFLSNVNIQAKKVYIKSIVEQWFMEQAVENNTRAAKVRNNDLSFQARKVEDSSGRQTDPYLLSTRGSTANNNVTIPLLENKVIGLTMPSENVSTNEAAVNSEKELSCDRHNPMLEKHNK